MLKGSDWMHSWLTQGIIINLICGLVGFFLPKIWDWFFYFRKSPYSGVWEGEIMNNKGQVEKRDTYKVKHNRRTNELSGYIRRMKPIDQNYRKWKMMGKIDGDGYILFVFSSMVSTHRSRGCAYLRHKEDNVFEGYYLEDHRDGKIDKTQIRLVKK